MLTLKLYLPSVFISNAKSKCIINELKIVLYVS